LPWTVFLVPPKHQDEMPKCLGMKAGKDVPQGNFAFSQQILWDLPSEAAFQFSRSLLGALEEFHSF
jgi:hypothetical protein